MNLDEEVRAVLVAQSELREPPPVDLVGLMARGTTRRRRRTTLRVVGAVAAMAIISGAAFLLPQGGRTAPEPAEPLPTDAAETLPDSWCSDRCLDPGTYGIPLGVDYVDLLRAELTIESDGWESVRYLHRISRSGAGGSVMLNVYEPLAFAGRRACAGGSVLAPDATMDDVVRRITNLPQFEVVEGPSAITAFGRESVHLRIRADRIRCDAALNSDPDPDAEYNLADIVAAAGDEVSAYHHGDGLGDSDIDPGQPVLIDLWVLALDGHHVVVEARQEGSPAPDMIEQLDQIRASLEFVVPE